MIKMEVFGLAMDEKTNMPLVILKDSTDKYILPIWIGAMEAMAISLPLKGMTLPRPMTHDLFLNSLEQLNAELQHVEVSEIKDSTYYAVIVLTHGDKEFRVDSRPSDAIAMAVRAKAPILVNKTILEQIMKENNGDYQVVLNDEEGKKWTEILEKYSLDDTKYKM
ncbi:bifunctional nuclease family protein [Desulfonatronovibrio magnus]|uniref:bifunctional nuclease family protein n=1 Tax=Desulfonatronovibrio magnus TaxID=698827 RepID=UPI0005EB63A5|nr:bifunctional nuclease family protein [Desulfonatronovibrio magnus]